MVFEFLESVGLLERYQMFHRHSQTRWTLGVLASLVPLSISCFMQHLSHNYEFE